MRFKKGQKSSSIRALTRKRTKSKVIKREMMYDQYEESSEHEGLKTLVIFMPNTSLFIGLNEQTLAGKIMGFIHLLAFVN